MSDPDLLARELPDIFHDYSITLAPGSVEAWKTVASSSAGGAGVGIAMELVLAAFDQGISGQLRKQLVEGLRAEHDGTYPSEGRDGELRALSAATLVQMLSSAVNTKASAAAFAVLAAEFNGWTSPATILPELARSYLRKGAQMVRRRKDLPKVRAQTITGKLGSLKARQWATPQEALPYVDAQATALRALARVTEQLADAVRSRQDAHDEEVDLLWWALNGRDGLGRTWAALPLGLRVALAASEAAHLTLFIPGPAAIETLLLRAVGGGGEAGASVAAVVAEAAAGWTDAGQEPAKPRGPLLPLLSALSEAVETKGSGAWTEVVEHKHGVNLAEKASVGELAGEFYREFLTLNILTEDEED